MCTRRLLALVLAVLWLWPASLHAQSEALKEAAIKGGEFAEEGRYEEAIPFLRKAIELSEAELGRNNVTTAKAILVLAKVYYKQGNYTETEPLFVRGLAILEKSEQEVSRILEAETREMLALIYVAQSRYNEAEPLYKRALEIWGMLSALGLDLRELFTRTLENYAALLRKTGRSAEATKMEAHAKAIREKRAEPALAATTPEPGKPEAAPEPREPEATPEPHVALATFRDCDVCPEMVVIPKGEFAMGSPASEEAHKDHESPHHRVTIGRAFALGKYEVTFDEWDACVSDGWCNDYRPKDRDWGRGRRPVINVNWKDAKAYVAWLSRKTGKGYRLPSEAEWEYAARAGTTTPFHFGSTISPYQANYRGDFTYGSGSKGVFRKKTVQVGIFPSNAFGLHDVHGNVSEWAEDCWHGSYAGAPSDGGAWTTGGDCGERVHRGGSGYSSPGVLRSASRFRDGTGYRISSIGFRVARTLTP